MCTPHIWIRVNSSLGTDNLLSLCRKIFKKKKKMTRCSWLNRVGWNWFTKIIIIMDPNRCRVREIKGLKNFQRNNFRMVLFVRGIKFDVKRMERRCSNLHCVRYFWCLKRETIWLNIMLYALRVAQPNSIKINEILSNFIISNMFGVRPNEYLCVCMLPRLHTKSVLRTVVY